MKILKLIKSHQTMTLLVYGGAALLLCAAVWVAYQYVEPLPPNKVTIATGGPSGAYAKYAREYADYFAKQGFELEIIETKGSMDNLAQMSAENSTIDAAFMQGGITTPEEHPDLQSLGSLYYEPIWLFHSRRAGLKNLTSLKRKRVAIGAEGSGTAHVVARLLEENGITAENSHLIDMGAGEAAPELVKGKLDALFAIAGTRSAVVESLTRPDSRVRLLSFDRAETYARSHPYLTKLTLPRGGIDLALDVPAKDVSLVAPTANLVVREDLHGALKYLFLLAADEIHRKGDIFARPGQFPNKEAVLFPLSSEAESFYKNGPPLLMRYLPFQLAVTLERLKILLIPLLTLLYPLFKVTPPAYRWQIRRRIFKWYKDLKALDIKAYDTTSPEEVREMLDELLALDKQVMETSVPLSYMDYIYSLRLHIRLIQIRLDKIATGSDGEEEAV
ncbi:TAXI family TRAP transporter solute-binding subunit [Pseudodesulfovibrio cashew]|uniref:TAXI family TRAP transporter solute-binding subunit n=1 Tax=Pseudodesulfovibrio cashew TaxID=2678688 RepID=A0A6I6JP54_9BACT|nr:TAXI family TRAP transporter solute-binding subunit [Pseudodesulfovibrio cashew]QGY39394.1 TAXI family TRAP transporter solute-binding subunit [Pseudodesulfovibrio cashew]